MNCYQEGQSLFIIVHCLHLAILCSGNAVLVQCDQIKKIGRESKPNRENVCVFQKLELQQMAITWFQLPGHNTKAYLLRVGIYAKQWQKLYCPPFFQNVHNICWSRLNMISDSIIFRKGIHHSYTYHFLFKDHYLIFSTSYCNKT